VGRDGPGRQPVRVAPGPGEERPRQQLHPALAARAGAGAANTGTFLGERHRRLRQRPGGGGWKKAGCAVGRSILVIVSLADLAVSDLTVTLEC
jgi:hypothetical protein